MMGRRGLDQELCEEDFLGPALSSLFDKLRVSEAFATLELDVLFSWSGKL